MDSNIDNARRLMVEARNEYMAAYKRYAAILESESSRDGEFPVSDGDLWTAIESYLDSYVRKLDRADQIVDPHNKNAFEFDDVEINRDPSHGPYFNVTIRGRVDWKEPYVDNESDDRGTRHWTVTYQSLRLVVTSATAIDESGNSIDITDRVKALYPDSIYEFVDRRGVPSESDEESYADDVADERMERRKMGADGY